MTINYLPKKQYNALSNAIANATNTWHGVVEEDLNLSTLQGKESASELKDQKHGGYAVRVRVISGKYPNADIDKQSKDHLPLARVTAKGSGWMVIDTPILNAGDHVGGHYEDDVPIIDYVCTNTGKGEFKTSYSGGFQLGGNLPDTLTSYSYDLNGLFNVTGSMQFDAYKDFKIDYDKNYNFFLPCPDDVGDTTVATTAIKNLIKELEGFKTGVNDFATTEILDKIQNAQNAINKASKFISGWISDKIKWLQEEIMKRINAAAISAGNVLPLNARFPIRDGQNILVEALYCLFNKILDNLEDFIADFLNALIDQFINVPLCIVEKFLQALLSQIVGLITSVLNAVSGIIGSVVGLITGVIDTIIDLLAIFSCEPTPPCPDVTEWNILEGGKSGSSSLDFGSILSSIESSIDQFSNVAQSIYDSDTGEFLGVGIDDFSFDIEGIFNDPISSCSGAPILCGSPTISFFGGGGSGASGNVIVGLAGDILGVDITDSGSGYTSAPYVTIADDCGIGRGVVATSEIGEVTDDDGNTTIGVIAVNIIEPGFGYPSLPDGSLGGDGRVWATPDQTIVVRDDGKYDTPYSPGDNIELGNGDTITYPDGNTTVVQTGTGTGGTGTGGTGTGGVGIIRVTAPKINKENIRILRGFYPSSTNGEYPIFLTLCGVKIINRGGNYSPDDKILITPDNGAELSVTFNSRGMIDKVKVLKPGNGFITRPKISIQSETGFNAKIIPILCVNRVGDDLDKLNAKVSQDQIIKVVDCVGKFR